MTRLLCLAALLALPTLASAQAVTLTNRAISTRNSFFENTGVSFGFGVGGSNIRANVGLTAAQGSRRSFGSTGVVGTSFSGRPLVVQGGLQRPFVTSVIPNAAFGPGAAPAVIPAAPPQRKRVIRGGTVVQNGRLIRLPQPSGDEKSRAPQIDPQKRARAVAEFQKGDLALASGRVSVARRYYQRAANVGDPEVQLAAFRRMAQLPAR